MMAKYGEWNFIPIDKLAGEVLEATIFLQYLHGQ
jgi:hypothetical protein